jgi:hypothetical protein
MSFVPHPSKIDEFLACLQASGLLGADEITQTCEEFNHEDQAKWRDADLYAFCDHLVKSNRLTVWQCDKLRNGQCKGFFLDHYRILDHIGFAGQTSYYLAEDIITQCHVRLQIIPKEGKPPYQVEDL